MPRPDPPEPASPAALRALVESAAPDLELIFFRFPIDTPAEKAEIIHDCLVRLSLEWEGIEIDRKIWFLAEVEDECYRRTDPPPPPERSEDEDLLS
jgi:hypothetical protein